MQNNNYSQSGKQCVTETEDGFTLDVAEGEIAAGGAPKSYPSLVAGCHWGRCTDTPGLPVRADDIGGARTSVSITPVEEGSWNAAYDLWFDQDRNPEGQNEGTELMIWFNGHQAPDPIGEEVATVELASATWTIWQGNIGWDVISFIRETPTTEVDLPLEPFVEQAIERGATEPGDWLTSVQAGFEPWAGGEGLAMENFTLDLDEGQGPDAEEAAVEQETSATEQGEQDAGQESASSAPPRTAQTPPAPTAQDQRERAPAAKSPREETRPGGSDDPSASGDQDAESAPDQQAGSASAREVDDHQASDAANQEPVTPASPAPTSSSTATTEKAERAAGETTSSTSTQTSDQEPKDATAPGLEQDRQDAGSPRTGQDAPRDSAKSATLPGAEAPTATPTDAPRGEGKQKEEEEEGAAKRALETAAPSDGLPATAPVKPGLLPEPSQAPASDPTNEKEEDTEKAKGSGDRRWWQLWLIAGEDTSAAEEAGPEKDTDDGDTGGTEPAQRRSPEQTRPTTSPKSPKEETKEEDTETRSPASDGDQATGHEEASGYQEAALADNPVMLLTGEKGGESMTDVVDPGREVKAHGKSSPATTPDGAAGVDLDGRSDYLEVDGKDLSIAGTGELTVEILMRPDKVKDLAATQDSSEGPMVHVLNKGQTFGDDGDQEWATRVYDEDSQRPGRVSGYAFNPRGGEGAGSYDQSGLEEGQWAVLTAVYDTTDKGEDGWGTVTMYRDGQEVDTDSLGQSYRVTPKDGGAPLFVGGGADDGLFDGAIGAVAVYPTAQGEVQIAERADAALSRAESQGAAGDQDQSKDSGKSTAAGKTSGKDEEPTTGAEGKTSRAGKSTGESAEQEEEPTTGARATAGATEKAGATS